LLIGDVPDRRNTTRTGPRTSTPTNYRPAKINTRWGSQPTIATDQPFADTHGDELSDVAVGRIPADSVDELAAVVAKIVRYEPAAPEPDSRRRVQVVAGVGGFGALADTLIEAAAHQVFQQTMPAGFLVQQVSANPASPHCPPVGELRPRVQRQLGNPGFAWIYLGHGLPTELDHVRTASGTEPILSVADVPNLRCGPHSPLAILVACYTGAFDSRPDCLAEELLLAPQGPIAVIAATRVTMPYGNTVLGYELLRACFHDQPDKLGDILRLAQRRSMTDAPNDPLRASLDQLARGISPPPVDLEAERREHVWMYHLLGDPLTRLRHAAPRIARSTGPQLTK
jgi:hypothetical protein